MNTASAGGTALLHTHDWSFNYGTSPHPLVVVAIEIGILKILTQ
jgi:hypothetical protein